MAVHYRQPPLSGEATLAAARRWLADESPSLSAFRSGLSRRRSLQGWRSVAIAHPGIDLQRLLFLKDLFVRTDVPLGRAWARACFAFSPAIASRQGIGRIDLTTEDWNEGALRLYDKLGAERHGQKVFFRFTPQRLAGTCRGRCHTLTP